MYKDLDMEVHIHEIQEVKNRIPYRILKKKVIHRHQVDIQGNADNVML